MTMTAGVMGLDHVDAAYEGRRDAPLVVSDVSIVVRPGEFTALVGASGSGKSTVGRILLLLLRPKRGRVHRFGRDVASFKEADRPLRARVQPVFQHPGAALDPAFDALATLDEPLRFFDRSLSRKDAAERAALLMKDVGLSPDLLGRRTGKLSGGEQQRLCIARALAARPDALILDEPLSALDLALQARVMDLLERLRAERRLAYLFISHDLRLVRNAADRVYVMDRGRVVEEGAAAEVLGDPRSEAAKRLVAATPSLDPKKARAALLSYVPRGAAAGPPQSGG